MCVLHLSVGEFSLYNLLLLQVKPTLGCETCSGISITTLLNGACVFVVCLFVFILLYFYVLFKAYFF